MSEQFGEKTEQPTPRRMEEAIKKGQIPKSAEVQTVFILLAAGLALTFFSSQTWRTMSLAMQGVLGHLHEVEVTSNLLPSYSIRAAITVAQCVGPIVFCIMLGGLLAGAVQNRFETTPEALSINWERLNPAAGLQRIFSFQAAVPTGIAVIKLAVVIGFCYGEVRAILHDPIFRQPSDMAKIAGFLASSTMKILLRITMIMVVIASGDYAYQWWKNHKELMMTKEEVKEEQKSSEGNAEVRAAQRKRRHRVSQRKMMMEVPQADVVVTNPTHLAIALRYDSKTMKAPKIVAKGARLHAQRIREIAAEHGIPIVENKPLARMMFKYGRVGGEVPAQLYLAVAEILAWVYRVNRYHYYAKANQVES